jgi:hypothetical protein
VGAVVALVEELLSGSQLHAARDLHQSVERARFEALEERNLGQDPSLVLRGCEGHEVSITPIRGALRRAEFVLNLLFRLPKTSE